jgi:ABC-type multidrug transport system fused ATPase/permease subunit
MITLVLKLVMPYRRRLAIVFVAMLVEASMRLAAPWPLKIIIDNVVGAHHLHGRIAGISDLLRDGDKMRLATLAAISTVMIAGVAAVASYIDNYYTESVGQWVANDLRMKLYSHLHRLSLTYYDSHQTSALLSTITDDVSTIQDFASSATLSMFVDLLTIIGIFIVMFWFKWDFAFMAAAVTPLLLWFVVRFKKAAKKAAREVRLHQSEILGVVQQGLESIRAVQAFGRQAIEEKRLGEASRATVEAALKARQVKSLIAPMVGVTVALWTAVIMWRGVSLILTGLMTVGTLTVFLAYVSKFFKPLQDLVKMANTVAQAAVGLERIANILDADTIILERPAAREPTDVRGEIAFEQVIFAYDGRAPVLRGINFAIRSGEHVGIAGPTGGGKSTLVSLVPRFYDPSSGQVKIDDVDVRDYTLQGLRKQIGFVLQDTALFRGSIRDNIAYGQPGATRNQVIEAARLANADEFISRMPRGYDTVIGERGSTLSGGQRQRIGIARAVIRNSPILILDEPTAALDSESEAIVMEALERLMEGRTVITITHRLSTIRLVDRIIVLNDGVVAEEGTPGELLNRGEFYREMFHLQSQRLFVPARTSASAALVMSHRQVSRSVLF